MDYFGSLWKRDYKWSSRGNSSPKAIATGTKERSNIGPIGTGFSLVNIDACPEDVLSRGAAIIDSNRNSPRHERARRPQGDYDDVFGGPPKYAFSTYAVQVPVQGFEEAFRKPSTLSPGWKDSDFPVFGSWTHDSPAVDSVSTRQPNMEGIYKGRLNHASGFQNDRSAAATPNIKPKTSSRPSSCVQSPARPASSLVRDRTLDEFLLASVNLKTEAKDFLSPGAAAKVASLWSAVDIPAGRTSVQELISGNERLAESKVAHQPTSTKCRNNLSTDYRDSSQSSHSTLEDKGGDSLRDQSDDYNQSSFVLAETVGTKKLPRVCPAPLHPDSSPRLKNQRSLLRRKFGMEPFENLLTETSKPSILAKEGSVSPSSNLLTTATVRSPSHPLSTFSTKRKSQNPVFEQPISSCSRVNFEALDKNIVKNSLLKPRSKEFDFFASAVAAIKNTESKFRTINITRQEEKQDSLSDEVIMGRAVKVSEKQGSFREQKQVSEVNVGRAVKVLDKQGRLREENSSGDKDDSIKSSWVYKGDNTLKSLSKDRQEREAKFSAEVLEEEEIEAREAVERERRLREEQRQKERERSEIIESLTEAQEVTTAETQDEFNKVAAESLKKGMTKQNAKPLAGKKSVAREKLDGTILVLSQLATENKAENLTNSEEDAVAKNIYHIDLTEPVEEVKNIVQDHKLANESDEKQSSFKSTWIEKGGEKRTAFPLAGYASAREAIDEHSLTSDFHVAEEDNTEEKPSFADFDKQSSNHVMFAELMDEDIKKWSCGKEKNLRALLSTLQYVLWPKSGWQPVHLTDIISPVSVKKVYKKATLCVHPDKMQQKGASLQQKYIAEKVFFLLKEAWNTFNSEEFL